MPHRLSRRLPPEAVLPAPVEVRDWSRYRADPRAIADALGHPALLADPVHRLLHETPALREMLRAEPEAERLRSMLFASIGSGDSPGSVQEVRTGSGLYLLRASSLPCAGEGEPMLVVVTVERREPEARSQAELRRRYALTGREATVALLLARGLSNVEIARALVISPHTARRHTERVLRRLDVRSRSEVASRVLF